MRSFAIALALALATLAVYWPVLDHELAIESWDYIFGNPIVRDGLTARGVIASFTQAHASNWHPLTWISHMLDVELFGANPAGHHAVNLLFHVAGTLTLFFVWRRMTGATWRPAVVAALFALHPLHVESVAWALERKDVLSGLLWFLTMACYVRYAARPGVASYVGVLVVFALGLMAKPMVVTLPVVLLLLDWWPLGRLDRTRAMILRRIVEKLPMLALAGAVSILTFLAQGDAVASLEAAPLGLRVSNALLSYVQYLRQALWPVDLAFYYPLPAHIPAWQVAAAVAVLAVATGMLLRGSRSFPYLATGWLWYLVTLLPVIGLVQVGAQARADRYTYVPLVGVFVLVAWGVNDLLRRVPYRRPILAAVAVVTIAVSAAASRRQVGYWRDSTSVLRRSVEVTQNNAYANYNLANQLKRDGDLDGAVEHYAEAVRVDPGFADAHYNLGNTFLLLGRSDDAEAAYLETLRVDPAYLDAYRALGNLSRDQGAHDRAIAYYRAALAIRREPDVLVDFAIALLGRGEAREATPLLQEALVKEPDAPSHNAMGVAWMQLGDVERAITHFRAALAIDPTHAPSRANLDAALGRSPAEQP